MSEMDIVERLRERTENVDAIFEAADEIASLRLRLERAEKALREIANAGNTSGMAGIALKEIARSALPDKEG